jgi:CheY-like chemotaxis protein
VHIVSANEATQDAMIMGAIGFLTKPVAGEDLERALERIQAVAEKEVKDLLLVEDSADLRKGILKLVGDLGVNVTEAATGRQAIEMIRSRRFDCMILDLGLTDMTGFELLKRLEDEREAAVPPVIVYTGRDLSKDDERELRRYAESIIIKGARSEERLLDEVTLFLHRMVSTLPKDKQRLIIDLHNRDAALEGKRVLLVDDDMRNLFAVSRVLTEKGLKVLKAEDGAAALKALDANPEVDIVLMDIMMPVMDGFEAMRRIRQQARHAKLPVIALTAKAMKEDREKCIEAGASDYLAKPVDVDKMLSMMRVWLYGR